MLWVPSGKFDFLIYLPSFCSKTNLENNNSAADKGSVLLKDTSADFSNTATSPKAIYIFPLLQQNHVYEWANNSINTPNKGLCTN